MKAITICQPYAELICLPDDHPRAKRVENRTWPTSYRGQLLIHAGKSRQWLSGDNYGLSVDSMEFGAVIGIATLIDCFKFDDEGGFQTEGIPAGTLKRFPWLGDHEHVCGPFCFVLTECRKFFKPVPYRGAQGFFNIPSEVVAAQLEVVGA